MNKTFLDRGIAAGECFTKNLMKNNTAYNFVVIANGYDFAFVVYVTKCVVYDDTWKLSPF